MDRREKARKAVAGVKATLGKIIQNFLVFDVAMFNFFNVEVAESRASAKVDIKLLKRQAIRQLATPFLDGYCWFPCD